MPLSPVQQKIIIDDIQDGVIILRGGALRAVVMTNSINFILKSTEEQDALIMKYQQFLNSLDFPVQILIMSRQLDISNYLSLLEEKRREQSNELLQVQISEYTDFIKNLVQISHIMNQSFFVVVPLAPVEKKEGGPLGKLPFFKKKGATEEKKSLEELKAQLWQRVEYIISGLSGFGVKATPLNSQELTELFYHIYNMGLKEKPTFEIGKQK